MIPLSVLDLAPIVEGSNAVVALRNTLDLAQRTEAWGYRRFWLAEHHNMAGIASAATPILIGHVAGGTRTIRVGAGGIMLPNHAPLVVAEWFGTLEALYPGRIDLGLGRAPGGDHATARALRRTLASDPDAFPQDVLELMSYFDPATGQPVRAVPGAGMRIPIWILGSSLFGAHVAAALGLPFAFASHFAPALLAQASAVYRDHFRPSESLDKSYLMLGIHLVAAETDAQAQLLWTSTAKGFLNLRRGNPGLLPPPDENFSVTEPERAQLSDVLACAMVGSPQTVRRQLDDFAARTGADELIAVAQIHDHQARLHSYEIGARVAGMTRGNSFGGTMRDE
jgi:luciferase family oxidoreductase group 1